MHANFNGGQWVGTATSNPNINRSDTRDTVGFYAQGGPGDVAAAAVAATAAFPAWSTTVPHARHAMLARVAAEIAARNVDLAELLAREEGKTLADAKGEVMRAAQIFDFSPPNACG